MINDIDEVKNQCKHLNSGISFAKDLVGAPPNSASPQQIADLAKDLDFSQNYIRSILKGEYVLSPKKAFIIRKKYEKEIT